MIGIIGAMEIEVTALIEKLSDKIAKTYSGVSYVQGKCKGTNVVVAKCGMGKVNAAMCAQTMILFYSPKAIINIGVAGALSQMIKVGDIIVGTDTVQHDYDLSPIGMDRGFIEELNCILLPCTPIVTEKLESVARRLNNKYYIGKIATGDQFINSDTARKSIFDEFGALACDMEGASIAQICTLNNTDFGIVRTISDNADDDSAYDFDEFVREAAQKSIALILEFFSCYHQRDVFQ